MKKQNFRFDFFAARWICSSCGTMNQPEIHRCTACQVHQEYDNVALKVYLDDQYICTITDYGNPEAKHPVLSLGIFA